MPVSFYSRIWSNRFWLEKWKKWKKLQKHPQDPFPDPQDWFLASANPCSQCPSWTTSSAAHPLSQHRPLTFLTGIRKGPGKENNGERDTAHFGERTAEETLQLLPRWTSCHVLLPAVFYLQQLQTPLRCPMLNLLGADYKCQNWNLFSNMDKNNFNSECWGNLSMVNCTAHRPRLWRCPWKNPLLFL